MKISLKWTRFAKNWLGVEDGRHCHWCKHIDNRDEGNYCGNAECTRYKGRIHLEEGAMMAKKCWFFELSVFYTKDENFDIYFKGRRGQ